MADLLIELGCEELPAGSVLPMAEHLSAAVHEVLSAAGLVDGAPHTYATPRRLAVYWPAVTAVQEDQLVERKGPSVKAAYDGDGNPTRALSGFLASAGATADQLSTVQTPKGKWLSLSLTRPGKTLADILVDALPDIVTALPSPRRMRWGAAAYEFVRPVQWLVVLHGSEVVPLSVLGLTAGRSTYGHRFHAPGPLELAHAVDYSSTLLSASVIPDFAVRRQQIVDAVSAEAERLGGKPVLDTDLVDEVTALVEWPVALAGRFDAEFLAIPKEALIQTMQENQRYFALLDESDQLMPAFVTVANIASSAPETVIAGNERVILPRFADTMFFWEQDLQVTLDSYRGELDRLSFQEKLGTVGDKVRRIERVAAWLSARLDASEADCRLAARLCKCDLASEIVKELAKMQGIAGRYYAARDGHPDSVCQAMESHYFPRHAGDTLPGQAVGQALALADKADTLVGIFGIGMKPKGASDPFGLRRAALGIVRILIEEKCDVDLAALFAESILAYGDVLPADASETLAGEVCAWVIERLRGYALEAGYAPDVIEAVLARQHSHPFDIATRLQAIDDFRQSEAAESLAAASKRIGNLLRKVDQEDHASVDPDLFAEPAERQLYEAVQAIRQDIQSRLERRDYNAAMTLTSSLREPLDAFFDGVMVMAEDPQLQQNRLAMLADLQGLCSSTAELARLQPRQ